MKLRDIGSWVLGCGQNERCESPFRVYRILECLEHTIEVYQN